MVGRITSTGRPRWEVHLRTCLSRQWFVGEHGFYVSSLVTHHEWIGPKFGSTHDVEPIFSYERMLFVRNYYESHGRLPDIAEWRTFWLFDNTLGQKKGE